MTCFASDSSMTVYKQGGSWPQRQPSCKAPTGQCSGEEPTWPGGAPQSSGVVLCCRPLSSVDPECHRLRFLSIAQTQRFGVLFSRGGISASPLVLVIL